MLENDMLSLQPHGRALYVDWQLDKVSRSGEHTDTAGLALVSAQTTAAPIVLSVFIPRNKPGICNCFWSLSTVLFSFQSRVPFSHSKSKAIMHSRASEFSHCKNIDAVRHFSSKPAVKWCIQTVTWCIQTVKWCIQTVTRCIQTVKKIHINCKNIQERKIKTDKQTAAYVAIVINEHSTSS